MYRYLQRWAFYWDSEKKSDLPEDLQPGLWELQALNEGCPAPKPTSPGLFEMLLKLEVRWAPNIWGQDKEIMSIHPQRDGDPLWLTSGDTEQIPRKGDLCKAVQRGSYDPLDYGCNLNPRAWTEGSSQILPPCNHLHGLGRRLGFTKSHIIPTSHGLFG